MREAGRMLLSGNRKDEALEFPASQAKSKASSQNEPQERIFDWAANGNLPMQLRKPLLA